MKNLFFPFLTFFVVACCSNQAIAQLGSIFTYAPLVDCNIATDNTGRVYSASGNSVYRIDSGGATTVVAGGGSVYGDGGPATAAQLNNANNVAFDNAGNMYISDDGYGVIRKVNPAGVISTVAGNYALGSGYTGDGGPATAAKVNCSRVCVDVFGNIFIADKPNYLVRKVNTSGIISTVAGSGVAGHTGDGGPATAARINFYSQINVWGITTDTWGNLYISEGNSSNLYIRKVNMAGIITTIAGNGTTSPTAATPGPATSKGIYFPQGLATDAAGNLYVAEWQHCVLTCINPAGMINTIAGNYTISSGGDGGPATAAGLNAVSDVAVDLYGNIYIADCHNGSIRKVLGSYLSSTYVADSFGVTINEFCSGPQVNIITNSYNSAYSVKCYYGDGSSSTAAILPGYSGSGFVSLTHTYENSGSYTLKTVLMNAGIAFDSITYTYEHRLCNTISTRFYFDANNNCVFDAGEANLSKPVLVQVDSNGTAIDTISTTSGINYTAYGSPGDIYTFKVIASPGNMHPTCPSTGIVSDTIRSLVYSSSPIDIGMQCYSGSTFDLSLNAIVPVTGVRDQWGDIFVSNAHCAPQNATVTLHYDRHYQASYGSIHPSPLSFSDSTITWSISGLSSTDAKPVDLYYAIWRHPDSAIVVGYPARSYFTVDPIGGDTDTSNNNQSNVDSVNGGVDPNDINVIPTGFINAGTQLQYTIHFTNTGNDTTYNVYVMDTLSDYLDISSFRLVMSSAKMNISKIKAGGHNIIKFDFPDINLLDSIHHPEDCMRGFVYTINVKPGLPDGTIIDNYAGIFFDFNPVVMTNVAQNVIGTPLSVGAVRVNELKLYPNPANTVLKVDNLQFATTYTIFNVVGSMMDRGELSQGNNIIDIKTLPPGVYLIKINGVDVRRFVKQ